MPPPASLKALAARRVALQQAIGTQRVATAALVTDAVSPLQKLDQLSTLWRRVPAFAIASAWPLGLFVQRTFFPQSRVLGALLRWSPVALGVLRGITAVAAKQSPASAKAPEPARTPPDT